MTYKMLIDALQLIGANIGEGETKGQKKLKKIQDKLKVYYEEWVEKRDELRLDAASVDDKGNLMLDSKGDYQFNKDAIKKLNVDLRNLMNSEFGFKKIEVLNPQGLEEFGFLSEIVNGVKFEKNDDEEL